MILFFFLLYLSSSLPISLRFSITNSAVLVLVSYTERVLAILIKCTSLSRIATYNSNNRRDAKKKNVNFRNLERPYAAAPNHR